MNINTEIGLECGIPLRNVIECTVEWHINQHAELELIGRIDSQEMRKMPQSYMGMEIELFKHNEFGEKESTIFKGVVSFIRIEHKNGNCLAIIKGISASKQLDTITDCQSFQDVSKSYADIVQKVITEAGGLVICTNGRNKIDKPQIRYKETVWEFIKRLASLSHTYVIPDIFTGRPNVWFGMRRGVRITEMASGWDSINIIKTYGENKGNKVLTSYLITSRELYQIGDYKEIDGQDCVIYEVCMELKRGELICRYMFAREKELDIKPYFNENFIGLSLNGKVVKTENENVCIKLDIDKEEDGTYFYQWKPETGNALYAMPELQTPVALYFAGPDERNAFGLRCLFSTGDSESKVLETITGNKMELSSVNIEVSKNNIFSFCIDDKDGINVSSDKKISIDADKKIHVNAKNIIVSVPDEIKFVTNN